MNLGEFETKHNNAMDLAALADLDKMRGNVEEAAEKYRQAYELEYQVAQALTEIDIEPSRSVIHRSAASLAIEIGEYRAAEKLIAIALAGEPPQAIARELRELLLQVVPELQKVVAD